jgi:HTH-type transcriptional regulator/antitoxin HigA
MTDNLRPIRTKADYKAAMTEIERLWGAKSGTPKGDRLDVLATLVEVYEAKHYPMDPPDPIYAILFRMEQQGLTRKALEPMSMTAKGWFLVFFAMGSPRMNVPVRTQT